ncbi:DEAD/DEAH box helicase family protein [Escherichia coli]
MNYSVFDISQTLLVMPPYQIAATERILWKINSSYKAIKTGDPQSGGFIWHTTGSGKTLTSFKAARLATELDFIDKLSLCGRQERPRLPDHEGISAFFAR